MKKMLRRVKAVSNLIFKVAINTVRGKYFPPIFIPLNYLKRYTLNWSIHVSWLYRDDSYNTDKPTIYLKERIDAYIEEIKLKKCFYYGKTDTFLYRALEKYSVNNKSVAIIGSTEPIYESVCLSYGGKPTTVEQYKKILLFLMRHFRFHPCEHDGLGRYGDKLNPDGDLEKMEYTKKMIRPRGLLYLAVPIGKDCSVWNLHRIYGRIRLPLLLNQWDLVDSFGFNEDMLDLDSDENRQPVFVLKNK